MSDRDDLTIEEFTREAQGAPQPGICICVMSVEPVQGAGRRPTDSADSRVR